MEKMLDPVRSEDTSPLYRGRVDTALEAMAASISHLDDTIGVLVDHISSVLHPELPILVADKNAKIEGERSAVLARLESQTEWIGRINEGLNNIIERVEL